MLYINNRVTFGIHWLFIDSYMAEAARKSVGIIFLQVICNLSNIFSGIHRGRLSKSLVYSSSILLPFTRLRNDLLCVEWDVKLY